MSVQPLKWVGFLVMLLAGCRSSDAVLSRKAFGTVYDTANEAQVTSGKLLPLLESWRDDAPVYAEPVAICSWEDGVSQWEIFFATNRASLGVSESDQREHFGNQPLTHAVYGRSEVTIPRRSRGVDAPTQPSKFVQLTGGSSQSASPEVLSTIDTALQISEADFVAGVRAQVERSRQRDVLIFVHGFNVDFDSSLSRAAQIALDMPFNGSVVAYSWPSQGGVQNYAADEPINKNSVAPFQQFLQTMRHGLPEDVKLHIMVHSMGNRIVLDALSKLPKPTGPPPITKLALMAPDVGLHDFQQWAPGVKQQCELVTLYASIHDAALIASKKLHGEQRAGDAHPPVIIEGIETVDCSAIDFTSLMGHSYYAANVDVLADLFMLIKRDQSASKRAHLKERKTADGSYWKWTATAPQDLWTWHFDHLATVATEASDSQLR
ncbi:alpha/beta hydrolase [bacterium]|nr:alpha/beta hydrolase [bacterium]